MRYLGRGEAGGICWRVVIDSLRELLSPWATPGSVVVAAGFVARADLNLEGGSFAEVRQGQGRVLGFRIFVASVGLVGLGVGQEVQAFFGPDEAVVCGRRIGGG